MKHPDFVLYVAPDGPVKCAACEWVKAWVAARGLDCEVREGARMEADAVADSRLRIALTAYRFETGGPIPNAVPLLIHRFYAEVAFDANDIAEMARRGKP